MDYSVPSLAILVSAVLVYRADRITHRITETDERYTHATIPLTSVNVKILSTLELHLFAFL